MKQRKQVKRMNSYTISAPDWINPTNNIGYLWKWFTGLTTTSVIVGGKEEEIDLLLNDATVIKATEKRLQDFVANSNNHKKYPLFSSNDWNL
jgi:hypothetical protein